MYPSVHWSTIYSSQGMEATYMPIDRKMDEEAALHFKKWIVTQP